MKSSINPCKKNISRILIVDDDANFTKMVKLFLSRNGYEAIVCNNGENALEYLKNNRVDLILLDVIMPEMDGFEVAKRIKEDVESDYFIPIIILSGLNADQDKTMGLKYADDYVTKPFSNVELIARIRALLRIRQLQNELLLSKTRYQCLYENIPEICLSLDKNRNISDCNTVFCKCFTVQKKDVMGKNVLEFFHPAEHEKLISFFKSLKPKKIVDHKHVFQMSCFDKDSNQVFVTIQAVCLGEHETGLYIIVAMKDMTKNVKLEEQQKLIRKQLYRSARLASIGTLASGFAHEINNPLTAILGSSDALLHRINNGEKYDKNELKQYLEVIKSEALRCRGVVENLSKLSRNYKSKIERVSLLDCLHSAISLMNVYARKKNISIVNKASSDVTGYTDTQKIVQVLIHILSNSIDFCEIGSIITIETEKPDAGKCPVKIKISDTGPGIPEEMIPKIFDPFFTTKDVGKGVGLGMSISYKLMEECKGSLEVTSKENIGTTVTLEIPSD